MFLASYLRSSLAKYFLFHTSSNWGVSRQEVHVEELLRLPFPLPDAMPDRHRAQEIVEKVAGIVSSSMNDASGFLVNRDDIARSATVLIDALVDEYFDILPIEKVVVDDSINVIIPSVRPTRSRQTIPTISPSTRDQQNLYMARLCSTLNGWSREGRFEVDGRTSVSETLGVGVAVLRKSRAGDLSQPELTDVDLLNTLERLRNLTAQKLNAFELLRGTKIFNGDHLYLVKPTGQRFWTETAALNDADEIAGTILMQTPQGIA
jgi:hypothetical protein